MKDFSLLDKNFSLSKITAYSLALEIDYNKIIYAIVDNIRKQFVAIVHQKFPHQLNKETFLEEVEKHIKNDIYLQKHYKNVDFIYPSKKFMIIPKEFFDKQSLKQIFTQSIKLEPGEELQFNYIESLNAYLVFAIPSDVTNFFIDKFPEISFYHQAIPLLNNYIEKSKNSESLIAGVNFRKDLMMDIIIADNGNLLFFNTFNYKNDQEAIFFIAKTLNNFDNNAPIELLGEIDPNSSLHKALQEYFVNSNFAEIRQDYEFSMGESLPVHYFVNLFHIV